MTSKRKRFIAVSVAATLGAGVAAAGIAVAASDDTELPITGAALEQAAAAASAHTGGGRVTGTEVGDEDGFYEVEVTRDDGSQVDVHLDQGFAVIGTKPDNAEGGDASDED